MKTNYRHVLAVSVGIGALVSACGNSYDTRPASNGTTAGTMHNDNETAINAIASEQCNRAVRCESVGAGKKYGDRQQCMADVRHEGENNLRAAECRGGIDHPQLEKCLADIRADHCNNVADHLTRMATCRTGALCVALGNYHNCGPGDRIAPEYVSITDTLGMARLCTAAATAADSDPHCDLRTSLEKRLAGHRRFFRKLAK